MNSLYENIAESLWTSCLNEDIGSAQWYISHLSEKALFGSMSSSMKKWTKQINQLEIEIAVFDGVRTTPKNVQAAIDQWKKSAEALTAKINDPDFQSAMKAVDDNTGWFGRDKGHFGKNSGLTSTRINKDNNLIDESVKRDLARIREAEEQSNVDEIKTQISQMVNTAKDFTEKTKQLASVGINMPGTGFKKFLKKAGPVLTMGAAVMSIAATALTGGAAAPVLMGVATGMKTVGLGLTAGRSFAGAGRAFARGENGKGALKTALGAASAVGSAMGLQHGIGLTGQLSQRAQDVANWDPNAAISGPADASGNIHADAPKTGWLWNKMHGGPLQDINASASAAPETYGMQFGNYGNINDAAPQIDADAAADAAVNAQEAKTIATSLQQQGVDLNTSQDIAKAATDVGGDVTNVTGNTAEITLPNGTQATVTTNAGEVATQIPGEQPIVKPSTDVIEASKQVDAAVQNVQPTEKSDTLTKLIADKAKAHIQKDQAMYAKFKQPNHPIGSVNYDGHNWHAFSDGTNTGVSTWDPATKTTHFFFNGQEVDQTQMKQLYKQYYKSLNSPKCFRVGDVSGEFKAEFFNPQYNYYHKAFNISSKVGTANLSNGIAYDYAPSTYGPELNDFFKA